jgi:alcohol dehydrogenase, propanol-preferring
MRAMVLDKPQAIEKSPLHLRTIPRPVPGAGEIRVSVRCCGLCHTDLHTVEGDLSLPRLPIVPGHQIVGFVDAVGVGVTDVKEGDRVGIPWLHSTDGTCEFCSEELENLCDAARFTGFHVDGGYAEYALAQEKFALQIPAVFSDIGAAPLLCAGIIGYRAFQLSRIVLGERLGLFGFGASAHLVLQFAQHLGCEVYVFTRSEAHRQLARQLGAAWVGGAEETPPELLDAAIIFAPAGALVHDALRLLRKGGTVALAGITMTAIPKLDYSLLYQERSVRSVANCTRQDGRDFLDLAADANLQASIETFPLAEANQALADLKHSRIEGAGVLILGED